MRIFLAGATGVIGRQLAGQLIADGHHLTAMTRSPERAEALRAAGAEPVVADALDQTAVLEAVTQAHPDAVIHQLTSIPQRINPRRIKRDFQLNDRLRTEGTLNLLAAARAAGASKLIAQSIAFMYAPGPPGSLHSEQDPLLGANAPQTMRRTALAIDALESAVLADNGIVLRYGYFYGPGTWIAPDGSLVEDLRRRRFPIVGNGRGIWPFVHVLDAAKATVLALQHEGSDVYNIVDDDPAPVREWAPALAATLGAPSPLHLPALVGRLAAGEYAVQTMTRNQGASNARAKRDLGWQPELPSWREGFRAVLQ